MGTINILATLFSAILLSGCGNVQKQEQAKEETAEAIAPQYPIHIPFEKGVDIEREVKLSDIAKSVDYIRLETTDHSLISRLLLTNIIRTSKYIILPEFRSLFQFTLDGKFVRKIGRVGQGPGEFTYVHYVDVDEKQGLVYLYSSDGRMNVYNLETGKYIHSPKLSYRNSVGAFNVYNDSTLLFYYGNYSGKQDIKLCFSTLENKVLKTYSRQDLFEVKSGASYSIGSTLNNNLYKFNGHICFKEYENDTVYTVTPNALEKRYILDLGKYSIPLECTAPYVDNRQKFQKVAEPYLRVNVVETENYLFFPYMSWAPKNGGGSLRYLMYDKKTKECFRIKGDGIINDIDGGLSFDPI